MNFNTALGLVSALAAALLQSGCQAEEAVRPARRNLVSAVFKRDTYYEALAPQEEYCAVSAQHTACLYSTINETGACAATIEKRGVTDEQIELLLAAHNDKRRAVAKGLVDGQPGATNMAALAWNAEAAAIAQLWVDQCTRGHDMKRSTVRPVVTSNGQNLHFMSGIDEMDFSTSLDGWFKEVNNMPPEQVQSFSNSPKDNKGVIGHYTQLVWAQSTEVGCGYIYQGGKHELACNYYPSGNRMGAEVYKTDGDACSACPESLPNCDDGLCIP